MTAYRLMQLETNDMRPITELAQWRQTHKKPVIDYCRWNEALESITKTNMDVVIRFYFIWPRVMLRTIFGV